MFIVTKFLTPEDVGLTAVIWEVAALFSSLAILGTSSSIMRFFPYFKDEKKKHNGFFFYIIALPFIGCLIFIPLYIILKEPISNFLAKSSEYSELFVSYYYWVIPLIFIITYWSIFENYSNANMRIVFPKFTREVLIKAMLIIVYVFFGVHILNRDGFVGAYIGVYGVAMFLTFVYVLKIQIPFIRIRNPVQSVDDLLFLLPAGQFRELRGEQFFTALAGFRRGMVDQVFLERAPPRGLEPVRPGREEHPECAGFPEQTTRKPLHRRRARERERACDGSCQAVERLDDEYGRPPPRRRGPPETRRNNGGGGMTVKALCGTPEAPSRKRPPRPSASASRPRTPAPPQSSLSGECSAPARLCGWLSRPCAASCRSAC